MKILSSEVLVDSLHFTCFFGREVLDSLIALEVILNVVHFSLGIDPLVGVRAVAVHKSVPNRCSSIREEDGNLMEGLWANTPEIPSSVRILDTSSGVSLLAMNEVRELDWVANEEHWSVVAHHIIVALFSVELNGKTTGIALSICRA